MNNGIYQDRAASVATGRGTMVIRNNKPVLYELDRRFRVMDLYPDYRQIVTLCMPTLEEIHRRSGHRSRPGAAGQRIDGRSSWRT